MRKTTMTLLSGAAGLSCAVLGLSIAHAQHAQSVCGTRYIAQAGETVEGIAFKCGVTTDAVIAANPLLSGRKGLRSGVMVSIPAAARHSGSPGSHHYSFFTPAMETVPARPHHPQRRGGPHYLVEHGDTLSEIAERYETSVWDLMLVNPDVQNPHVLTAGEYIRLPYGVSAPKPRARRKQVSGEDISVVPLPSRQGTQLSVQLGDFPPNEQVKIGLGKSAKSYAVVSGGKTDNFGRLIVEFVVPRAFDGATRLIVVAESLDETASAISQPITLPLSAKGADWDRKGTAGDAASPANDLVVGTRISFEGVVTGEGKECPSVRDEDGRLFSLTATEAQLEPGDVVRVKGIVAPGDWCAQGISIATASIAKRVSASTTSDSEDYGARRTSSGAKQKTPYYAEGDARADAVAIDRPYWTQRSREYVRGIVVSDDDRCTTVHGDNGQLYAIDARLRSVSVGDRVELLGSTQALDPCGSGIGFDVEQARKYSKYGS